jgi:hypothetical protein
MRTRLFFEAHRSLCLRRNVIRGLSAIVLTTVITTQAACGSDGEIKRQDLSVIKPERCAVNSC